MPRDDPMNPLNVKSGSRMNTLSVTHRDYRVLWNRCRWAEIHADRMASAIELFTDPDNPGSLDRAEDQMAGALAEYQDGKEVTDEPAT